MLNFNSMLRLMAAGSKYAGIVMLPFLFEASDVALIAIMLGLERFISFLFSIEAHGVFNREIIQGTSTKVEANSSHISVLVYGMLIALSFTITYLLSTNLVIFLLPIAIIGLSSGFLNDITRKAQAYHNISAFSKLSFLKSAVFFLSLAMLVALEDYNIGLLALVWSLASLLIVGISIYFYGEFFESDISQVRKNTLDIRQQVSNAVSLRYFILLGSTTFGLGLMERTVINTNYGNEVLSSYFMIQSVVIASLVLYDILLWGPLYPKIVEFSKGETKFAHLLKLIKSDLIKSSLMTYLALITIVGILGLTSTYYYEVFFKHICWILSWMLLLIMVPIDTLLIYFCHGKRLDKYNAWAACFSAILMLTFLTLRLDQNYLAIALLLFYSISSVFKLLLLRRDGLVFL